MKSFLQIVEEQESTHNPVVMAFGRMNPPTTGHLKLIDKVKDTAEKMGAKHTVVVSHSQDSKKNPLSGKQKVKHLERYSPDTHFENSSKDAPTILHHAAKLHASGHDHLVVVAGSDRVKEMHALLHKYNGVKAGHGYYNFKKISVVSAGHRDPDAEGAEGVSGTKMREHAKNNDFSSFRQGVPAHVSDTHAKELMKDTRAGMGLNEEINRGKFRAIFVTGGPGSGKDIIIREAIAEYKIIELNFIQIRDALANKQNLKEYIKNRSPLIINGPADDNDKIAYIKEELQELGYETMMIFVTTSNQASQERNEKLSRMMVESVRKDRWLKAQQNTEKFVSMFENFYVFENTSNIDTKEEDITKIYESTKLFLDSKKINENASDWLNKNDRLDINIKINQLFREEKHVKKITEKNSKSIQRASTPGKNQKLLFGAKTIRTIGSAKGPADITPDNSGGRLPFGQTDSIKGDTFPRKNTGTQTGYSNWASEQVDAQITETQRLDQLATQEESQPTIKWNKPPKEPNFNYDKDKIKRLNRGDKSGSAARVGKPDGVGSTWDTRTNGSGLTGGAGLGGQTYSEDQEYSNANPASTAMPSGGSVNPLSSDYNEKKDFKSFRNKKKVKESIDDPGANDMGVGGVLGGSGNKEGMETYKDPMRNIGIEIKKKKVKPK